MEKEKVGFKTKMKNFFGKIKGRFKAFFNKEYLSYSFEKYKAFTALQYKEVFGREKAENETREKVIRIASPLIKFAVVFGLAYAILFLGNGMFGIIQPYKMYELYVFVTTVLLVLQLLTSTASSTKSYYIAEDNKVLITFPSSGASLFLSKVTIEFIKELKSMLGMFVPLSLALIIYTTTSNPLAPFSIASAFWMFIPMLFICAIVVLFGSLLSVLYLQYLNKIPADIELRTIWIDITRGINAFLDGFMKFSYPFDFLCSIICGETGSYRGYKLTGLTFGKFALLLAITLVAFILVFVVIKRLFLHMMTKSVDYEKVKENTSHPNHVHHRHTTFAFKEFKISFRTLEISGSYIVTYVLIPVLILLLCKIFNAINTNMRGDMLTIMFLVLLISLPLLASNTPLSSAYSREGHAGYIKKTKPIAPYTPMISKLLFNLILSVPCIFASMFIVGKFGNVDTASIVVLGISVLLVQYAHIFYSSTLDFTKPRNESYQTEGQDAKNPNENTSTVIAFVLSFVLAGLVFFFFNEQVKINQELYITSASFIKAAVRVLVVSIAVFASAFVLYILKLKAFFMER